MSIYSTNQGNKEKTKTTWNNRTEIKDKFARDFHGPKFLGIGIPMINDSRLVFMQQNRKLTGIEAQEIIKRTLHDCFLELGNPCVGPSKSAYDQYFSNETGVADNIA
jgi:hypothetical protein